MLVTVFPPLIRTRRAHLKYLLLWVGLLLFPAFPAAAQTGKALATGTFWQLGQTRLNNWSDQQLADEVAEVKRAGMDTILIHYSAMWESPVKSYRTFAPNDSFATFHEFTHRDPLRAIFRAAERHNVKIILGDFLIPPDLRYEQPEEAIAIWLSPKALAFRRHLINKFADSPSFVGYYISNEPNPYKVQKAGPQWVEATRTLARFIREQKSDLKIIHSIGLYAEWHAESQGKRHPSAPSPAYLDQFWRPWIEGIPEIDIWMMIDGIGTSLSYLEHADKAQAWGRTIAHEAGKTFWVDVENAVMGAKGYHAFPMKRLQESLEVAAKYADKIVLFEHLSYMSPNSRKPAAQQLYREYLQYRAAQ